MPRISAPTVAEHRVRQREALLSAATDILVADGLAAVSPASVGAAAGLARSSVYQYFDSSAALLAAIVEDAFPRADAAILRAVEAAPDPAAKVDAYVRAVLRLAADGTYRPAAVLAAAELPGACRVRLDELYDRQAEPLAAAVRDLGVPDPVLTVRLVRGALRAAIDAVDAGAPARSVTRRTLEFVRAALGTG